MTLAAEKEAPPIATDDQGAVRVGGTRVLLDLVVYAFDAGASPEEIASSYPALSLSDVYSTLAYVLRHRAEVDSYLSARQREAEQIRRRIEERFPTDPLRRRLLTARGASETRAS